MVRRRPRRETAHRQVVAEPEEAGRTAIAVRRDGAPVGALGIAYWLRPDAKVTVAPPWTGLPKLISHRPRPRQRRGRRSGR
ncbi:hypothetical protein AVW11_19690 [Streptomyces amritsarensis]|uniref:Acetyltransferase n=1 Tax=Streptomyces amritsarensis TaxID=681158 RepID=A0ABX3G3H2_9ACTN|nr:hypothetical protein AVW11_19690 [Streptomyces amritsarensis]